MPRTVRSQLKPVVPFGYDENMSADLTHPVTGADYHLSGEMYVCPYTSKSAAAFSEHPKYTSLVAEMVVECTMTGHKTTRHTFHYMPLEGTFLKADAFQPLRDASGAEVFLAMNDIEPGQMKMRRVVRPTVSPHDAAKPALHDVLEAPEVVYFFAKMFMDRIF